MTGWDLTSASCSDGSAVDDISLSPGESITCTFTNTRQGTLIVDKVTVPGGDAQSFNFTAGGAGYSNFSQTDAAAPNSQDLVPGTYSVSETLRSGWDLTSATCDDGSAIGSIGLSAGETVTCTFTNTKRGSITVVKDAVPNDAQDFSFTGTGPSGYNFGAGFDLDDDSNGTLPNSQTFSSLVPGTYTLSEGAVTGWDLTSASCSDGSAVDDISLSAGESITCTFTNTRQGTLSN